jgi:tetratricopeptide (TPR) repeat protein
LGIWRLNRGELALAESHCRTAIRRLTLRNANPSDGEPFYHLGLTLRLTGRDDDAYASFYKSAWNAAWRTPAYVALAQIDCAKRDWAVALQHVDQALRTTTDHLLARNLKVILLRKLGRQEEAETLLAATLSLDPLDWLARFLAGHELTCRTQTQLDLALDLVRAGLWEDAQTVLLGAAVSPDAGTAPLVQYYLGHVYQKLERSADSAAAYAAAAAAPDVYCFPARVEEIGLLKEAIVANPGDARAHYYLGNLLYDRLRHEEAIHSWETAANADPTHATTWRNLGIAYFNVTKDAGRAADAYRRAVACDPDDARLLFEQDQLAKRLGMSPQERLGSLRHKAELVRRRDDLSIEFCALLNQTGQHEEARQMLASRHFQPWEGGEGQALGQHVRTHLALARRAMNQRQSEQAIAMLKAALLSPANLGEAKHLLANQSDVYYLLGLAHEQAGDITQARSFWTMAADKRGDFLGMAVQPYSEMTYYTILALKRLGREADAEQLRTGLAAHAQALLATSAKIDYFATSLPTMLLFDEDIDQSKNVSATVMLAQALLAAGQTDDATRLLQNVLHINPSHAVAADLLGDLLP